jgi:hypothetical protein
MPQENNSEEYYKEEYSKVIYRGVEAIIAGIISCNLFSETPWYVHGFFEGMGSASIIIGSAVVCVGGIGRYIDTGLGLEE